MNSIKWQKYPYAIRLCQYVWPHVFYFPHAKKKKKEKEPVAGREARVENFVFDFFLSQQLLLLLLLLMFIVWLDGNCACWMLGHVLWDWRWLALNPFLVYLTRWKVNQYMKMGWAAAMDMVRYMRSWFFAPRTSTPSAAASDRIFRRRVRIWGKGGGGKGNTPVVLLSWQGLVKARQFSALKSFDTHSTFHIQFLDKNWRDSSKTDVIKSLCFP